MAVISEIREVRGLVEISLDGMVWLRVRKKHFHMRPLREGDAVDSEDYLQRLAAVQAADCYEAALTALDQAAQASGDLTRKLVRKGFVQPAAEAAVERLCANGLIDDHRYAERIAQGQLNKAAGVYAVRRKLQAKHLSEEAIEAAMEDFDPAQQAQACAQAAARLWRKYSVLPPREGRAKLAQALSRRGFAWDAIHSAMEAIGEDADEYDC